MKADKTLVWVVVVIAAVLLFRSGSFSFFSIAAPRSDFSYAGSGWTTAQTTSYVGEGDFDDKGGSGSFSIADNGFLVASQSVDQWHGSISQGALSSRDLSDIDSILVIYTYTCHAGTVNYGPVSGHMSLGLADGVSASDLSDAQLAGIGSSSIISGGCENNDRHTSPPDVNIAPTMVKLENNHNGSWTLLNYVGIGDLFTRVGQVNGGAHPKLAVHMDSYRNNPTGSNGFGDLSQTLTVYNIVLKTNEVVQCTAGEVLLENGSCAALDGLLLENDRAIREQLAAELARIEATLNEKQDRLQSQIDSMNAQLQDGLQDDPATLARINSLAAQLEQLQHSGASQAQIDAVIAQLNATRDSVAQNDANLARVIQDYINVHSQLGEAQGGLDLIKQRMDTITSDSNPYAQNPIYSDQVQQALGKDSGSSSGMKFNPAMLLIGVGAVALLFIILAVSKRK